MTNYPNRYCWCGNIRKFTETPLDTWITQMTHCHETASPYPLSPQNLRVWKNSYFVLQNTFQELPSAFQNVQIVFEYCLPKYPPKNGTVSPWYIWADAILVSCNTAVVLEFKDRSDAIIQHARQARMYRNRLQKYHDESIGMRKWSILVPTLSSDLLTARANRVTAASPNMLASALRLQFGSAPLPHPAIDNWLNFSYSIHS